MTRRARATSHPAWAADRLSAAQREVFQSLYCDYFDFVYRNLRRLGVAASSTEDALQEVYLVVLRQIDRYQPGTHPRAWLFAITHRVASNHRRTHRRRRELSLIDADALHSGDGGPYDDAKRRQAGRLLRDFLDSIDEKQRSVFVMAELEQMTAPEISQALGENVNTVYARLRAARKRFNAQVQQWQARAQERDDG